MAFDLKGFQSADFQPRTYPVPVPGMAVWFNHLTDEQRAKLDSAQDNPALSNRLAVEYDVVWTVRGMEDNELEKATDNARENRNQIAEHVAAIIRGGAAKKSELGEMEDDLHPRVALRVEYVHMASVSPEISIQDAVKLAKAFPVEFRVLSTKVLELTGLGQVDEKKLKPSGKVMKSA